MMKIFIVLLLLPVYHFGMKIVEHPIGPSFISMFNLKQKLYYYNLGTRLDCSSRGNPSPMISWFRLNNSDNRLLIPVHPSKFIEIFQNGSLFIRPFQDFYKPIHAASYVCQAQNPAGSIQSLPIEIKPQMYDAYEIEVKNPYGFLQSSVIISCEISPPIASSYVNIIGWLEKVNNQIIELDLRLGTRYNLLTNKNLIIHNLTQSDDDRSYACMIQNQIDNQTKTSPFKTLRVRNRSPFGPELSIPNNTEYHGQSGDLIELPCGIASYAPNAQISWWKDGRQIVNNKDYLILQLSFSVNDSGIYSCQVEDESIGRLTSSMSLKVHYPITCQMNIQNTDISAGSNQELICSIHSPVGSSDNHWQWYHNSLPLLTKLNRYTIINVTRKHMGMYQCCYDACCAQKQIRIINSSPFLLPADQIYRNSIIITPKTMTNISIDLNCTIYGHPSPNISVYKDGEKLPVLNNQIEYLQSGDIFLYYRISILSLKDTGLYECRAENSFGSISFSKHINIEHQKPLIQPLINRTQRASEEFTVYCYASGQPHLYLQWRDESTNQIMNTSSTSPVILITKSLQSKIYSCEAKNSFGEISSKMFVKIENPARILSLTSNRTVKINQSLEVHCFTAGNSPFELTFETPLMKKQYENRRNISFIIVNLQLSDSGLYTCHVKNNYSEDQAMFEIIVQDVPSKIENILIENSERISWIQPFDGNSKILKYILRIRSKQNHYLEGSYWSNETSIFIENHSITTYSFENIHSQCTLLIIIQAENTIGLSNPSNAVQLQIKSKQLSIAPYNIKAVNISDKSVRLSWQYPFFSICDQSKMKFIIEIFDQFKQIQIESSSTDITIHRLKSYTSYSFVIYAVNELGPSPKSKSFEMQTSESVPLVMITDFTGYLLDNSTASLSWTFNPNDSSLINGKFRTYSIAIYENFNMSTLTTIETIHSNFILSNLYSSSQYFISVSICNYFDCGSSSSVIILQTSTSSDNRSISTRQLLTKPSSIRAKLHFTKSNQIGLKILYPSELIENLIISYKIPNNSITQQLNISPPILNLRLNNLLCGNIYEITIHTSNQMGMSNSEYLIAKTDGSVPILTNSNDLFEIISHNYILLNMAKWITNECPILFYEIEINSTRYTSSKSRYQISNLQANQIYQMNLRIYSEAGETSKEILFRTIDDYEQIRLKNEQLILIMCCIAILFLTLTCVFIISKFYKKKNQPRQLKPIVYSKKNQRYYPKIENDLTIENYRSDSFVSEDSHGNINPYAVTGYTKDESYLRPSERYFCPIILESSTRQSNKPFLIPNLSTISSPADSGVHSTYQDNPFYEIYDQTVHSPQYSLV